MRADSLPAIGIPFPRSIASPPSSPSIYPSDAKSCFLDTPTSMPDRKRSSQSFHRKTSLKWLSAAITRGHTGTSVRVPSLTSVTTVASTLHRTGDLSVAEGDAASHHQVAPVQPIIRQHTTRSEMEANQGGSRSVLRFFARSLSKRKSTTLQPLQPPQSPSSPSLSAVYSASAPTSPTLALQTGSTPGLHHEHGAANPPQDLSAQLETVHMKRHSSQTTPRLRKKSNAPKSDKTHRVEFNPEAALTLPELESARNLEVFDGDGVKVKFEDLWKDRRTCVIFIRHFWCPFCMDYTHSISENVDPDVLRRAGVGLVVISNGSPAMIKSYQSIFNFPFQIYTDPSLAVYDALGMTLRTLDGGPNSERGEYIEHGSASGIAVVLKNAVTGRLPLHKNGGDIKQLGGEFVLGPGLRCSYTSRMRNTRSHTPILDVLSAAGVNLDTDTVSDTRPRTPTDEEQWMKEREAELKKIRARKGQRRGFIGERHSVDGEFGIEDTFPATQWN